MKLAQGHQSNVLATNSLSESSAFNIARTPHMFNILSSGLYSDKIRAVLREIGCNAMDAHIMNGIPDRPFLVKLPSAFDNTFYIQDWGPGLDHEEALKLYTTYGWSNKQTSDDVTGGFGLGSKSPFAYTLQNKETSSGFTIESVKQGKKRIYSCFINEEGSPEIGLLFETSEIDPKWTHGLKVSFSVQKNDINAFHEKAYEVFKWFKVKPDLLGANFTLSKEDPYIYKSSTFAIPQNGRSSYNACVVMGNVRYPIDRTALSNKLTPLQTMLLEQGVVLFLDIGQVMMTPSREHLEYTSKTIKGLQEAFTKAEKEYFDIVSAFTSFEGVTPWETDRKNVAFAEFFLPHSALASTNSFDHLFKEKIPNAVDRKTLFDKITKKYVKMPSWAGYAKMLQQPGQSWVLEQGRVTPGMTAAEIFKNQEDMLEVWYFQFNERGGKFSAVKRKVVGGKIYSPDGTNTAVSHSLKKDLFIFYMDGSVGLFESQQLVRHFVVNKNDECAAILVGKKPSRLNAGEAQAYAELMASPQELGGVFVTNVKTLKADPSLVAALATQSKTKTPRLKKKDDPRVFFADTEVFVLQRPSASTTTTKYSTTSMKLGDLKNPEEMLYIVNSEVGTNKVSLNSSHKAWEEFDEEENLVKDFGFISGYEFRHSLAQFSDLLVTLGYPALTKIVVLKNSAQVKRLKMQTQGFTGLFTYLKKCIKDPSSMAKIEDQLACNMKYLSRTEIDFDYVYRGINNAKSSPIHFWGCLMKAHPQSWETFKKNPKFYAFCVDIEEKVKRFSSKAKKQNSSSTMFSTLTYLLDILPEMQAAKFLDFAIKKKSELEEQQGLNWDVSNEEIAQKFHIWKFFDHNTVYHLYQDISSNPSKEEKFFELMDFIYVQESVNILSMVNTSQEYSV